GNAERHLAAFMQFLDDRVVLRVILKSATGVYDARETEPVQFAHEMPRGIQLMLRRQFRTFGERGVKNRGVRTRDEQSGWIAFAVALVISLRRAGRFFSATVRQDTIRIAHQR